MLKKVLSRALAGTAATALIAVPGAMTIAPQIAPMACTYPDPASTSTDVSLTRSVAPYGSRNFANVDVDTAAAATPRGRVAVRLVGKTRWVLRLNDGAARQRLPRFLDAGRTYEVRANYRGTCRFRPSSDTAFYTVERAAVNVNPFVLNKRKAVFAARFRGLTRVDPSGGRATFVVKNARGRTIRAKTVGVRNGYARVNVKNLNRKRNYTLRVVYRGTSNFQRSADSIRF